MIDPWLHTEGQTTATGKPINVPGEPGPRKITTGEMTGKFLGFQPLSSTKSFEMHKSLEELKSYRDEKVDDLANRFVQAQRDTDQKGVVAVQNELREWNRDMVVRGTPELRINLHQSIIARLRPAQPMKQMRGLAKEYRESYGM